MDCLPADALLRELMVKAYLHKGITFGYKKREVRMFDCKTQQSDLVQ